MPECTSNCFLFLQLRQFGRGLHELRLPDLWRGSLRRSPSTSLAALLLVPVLVLRRRQLLRVGQVIDSDGQEHVQQGVVAEQGQDDEVERVDVARAMPPLRLDALVHHFVPILPGQDLCEERQRVKESYSNAGNY